KESVFTRFNKIAELKSRALHPQLRQAFDGIFAEFGDFIEGDMVPFRIDKGIRDANIEGEPDQGYEMSSPASLEKAMHEMYGRSADEVREIKERNRKDVIETIKKMADEPYVTAEMLQELHQVNNKDIVPKEGSRFRTDEMVGFGVRAGLLGKDVGPEMELLVERANDLIDREALKGVSKLRWEVEAASLHNDMLDIHPFQDRNGSTSLMFLELMMAKKGYEPQAEREESYYANLAKILGYNPAAIAVVGYEQAKIAHVPGFFEGDSLSKERKEKYIDEINEAAEHFVQMKMKRGKGKTLH
ncbi:Fic family protein, partial [Patescibacteria group bacterium]